MTLDSGLIEQGKSISSLLRMAIDVDIRIINSKNGYNKCMYMIRFLRGRSKKIMIDIWNNIMLKKMGMK